MKTGKLLAAAPETDADILYAGGFNAPDEVVWFELDGVKRLVVSMLEFARAKTQAPRSVEIVGRELFFENDDRGRTTETLLANLSKKYGVAEWLVPGNFPVAYADSLRSAGIRVTPSAGMFFPERMAKSADEIAKIAEAERFTEQSMMLAKDILRRSRVNSSGLLEYSGSVLTAERLRAEIEGFLKSKGYTASGTITSCGADASQPHNVGSGPLRAGETIIADIFPRCDAGGYWGDMTRTFIKGKPRSAVMGKAFHAVLEASKKAESMLRAGVIASEVHQAASDLMRDAGFPTGHNRAGVPCGFFHGLGHGVGLEIHEPPRVSLSNPNLLAAGNVVSNEPGLYNPEWGGIRLEDLVLIEPDSCRNFCSMEKDFEV